MSARKGSNGIQDGEENLRTFLAWASGVDDFNPYIHQGVLSISRVAREAGLNRDVFYTNPDIRDIHWPRLIATLEEQGVLKQRVANPVEVMPRSHQRSHVAEARIKQIQEEHEAVKAENRELRAQLEKFKGIDEILRTTGRLPW